MRTASARRESTRSRSRWYIATGPTTRTEELTTDDLAGIDFELARPGSISGAVLTDEGDPLAGVVLTVESDDISQEVTTDASGAYAIVDLPPDTYDLTITAPEGRTIIGPATATFVVTAAGGLEAEHRGSRAGRSGLTIDRNGG
ncbi:carboxypeptidase-like regulatory domain-containing protein [Microbacterium sp. Root280D1]|uniref:carboxypeptidase-like regulatory domain-containing protein n=1 Tax=Microbacterium sp. Root280D1 TaxID=1736510 RepID=UPI0006F22CFA|nr:carboxypeptidase-like regulatory domain-containing protein [Microbacterium sp. Root280D1]KRD53751.1 hypothetical protein ASE34_01195 [Microbacterium sp. Root280D1]